MNDYDWLTPRIRGRHLLIVEGNHEKERLLKLLLNVYPEIDIRLEDIIIYGTNIYMLYEDIVKEYQEDWDEQDVDLPYVISGKMEGEARLYKQDFINIFLMFDYERHDPNFSEDKINRMQKYFNDVEDVGILFLNYPMIESYQDILDIPDDTYEDRKISVTMQPGYQYKNSVNKTIVANAVEFPNKIKDILIKGFNVDMETSLNLVERLLKSCNEEEVKLVLENDLKEKLGNKDILTLKYQISREFQRMNYMDAEQNYYKYMRNLFSTLICHNICKANKLQNGIYNIELDKIKFYFENLKYSEILKKQNNESRDPINGVIWVLNTSVFLIPDYNFNLLDTLL